MGHKSDTKRQMYADLMERYRYVVDHYSCADQTEAYIKTITSQAKRFYVNPRWAVQRLAPMFKGDMDALKGLSPNKRQMYEDLFKVVVKLSSKLEFQGKSLYWITQFAVLQPAPRFYVDPPMMSKIYHTCKHEMRNGLE